MKSAAIHQLFGAPGALLGGLALAVIVAAAVAAPWIAGTSPLDVTGPPFLWPLEDPEFPLGTDIMGRDILAGVIHGGRVSLSIGISAGLMATLLGLSFGVLSGYYGGWVDQILMRVAEFFQIMPSLLFTIVLIAVLRPRVEVIVAGIALTSWPQVARLVRVETLRIKKSDFVQAATVAGMKSRRKLLTHIVPNVSSPAIVMIAMLIGQAILTESALSFLGLGDPNRVSWGGMIGTGREALRSAWYMMAIPGAAILVTVTALNQIGNAVNDRLNPRPRAWL